MSEWRKGKAGRHRSQAAERHEPLRRYVDDLFRNYKPNRQIQELKEEILSNLEAKVDDLTASGIPYPEAVRQATADIQRVDVLIDGRRTVAINRLWMELARYGLLLTLTAWILTIPFTVLRLGLQTNLLLMGLSVAGSILYFAVYAILTRWQGGRLMAAVKTVRYDAALKRRTMVWGLWGCFIAAVTFTNAAVTFGSNIWFARPFRLDGLYQLAVLAARFGLPLVSIIVPLLFHRIPFLILKHEAEEAHEA